MLHIIYRAVISILGAITGVAVGLGLSFAVCFSMASGMPRDGGAAMAMVWGMLVGPVSGLICGGIGFSFALVKSKKGS